MAKSFWIRQSQSTLPLSGLRQTRATVGKEDEDGQAVLPGVEEVAVLAQTREEMRNDDE
jgi:hypothetical protein